MCKLLIEWSPSEASLNLLKLNGLSDEKISNSLDFLKNKSELVSIDDISGYDNWNSFFIMFCIKANKKSDQPG